MKVTNFITGSEKIEMLQEAILCKMQHNRDAYNMITNLSAREALQNEISQYNEILRVLCDDCDEIVIIKNGQ